MNRKTAKLTLQLQKKARYPPSFSETPPTKKQKLYLMLPPPTKKAQMKKTRQTLSQYRKNNKTICMPPLI